MSVTDSEIIYRKKVQSSRIEYDVFELTIGKTTNPGRFIKIKGGEMVCHLSCYPNWQDELENHLRSLNQSNWKRSYEKEKQQKSTCIYIIAESDLSESDFQQLLTDIRTACKNIAIDAGPHTLSLPLIYTKDDYSIDFCYETIKNLRQLRIEIDRVMRCWPGICVNTEFVDKGTILIHRNRIMPNTVNEAIKEIEKIIESYC